MAETKSEMPLFIQGMYATVLGVSFYKIALQDADGWKPVETWNELFFFLSDLPTFIASTIFFKFILFGFTLLILAHDWYTYHLEKIEKSKENYWHYLPQVFSLFFLAQMFASVEKLNLRYWYIFGLCYTIANVFNVLATYDKGDRKPKWIKYSLHTLAIVSALFLFCVPNEYEDMDIYSSIAFSITVILVIVLWIPIVDRWLKKKFGKKEDTTENDQEKIIAVAENEARTARANYLKLKELEIEDTKITAAEKKITNAEDKAKEERKKMREDLATAKETIKNLKKKLSDLPKKASKG